MTNASIRLCTFNALTLAISHVLDTQSRMMGSSSSYVSYSVFNIYILRSLLFAKNHL